MVGRLPERSGAGTTRLREAVRRLGARMVYWALNDQPDRIKLTLTIGGRVFALGFYLEDAPDTNRRLLRALCRAAEFTLDEEKR